MKNYSLFILLFTLLALTGCAGKEFMQVHVAAIIPEETPTAAQELPPPIPPADSALLEYAPNGHPKNGIEKIYDRSGKIIMERHYLDGYRHGPQNYYNEVTGTLLSHYFYDKGHLHTFIDYYPNGEPKLELKYVSNEEWLMRSITYDGTVFEETLSKPDN